MKLKSIKLCNFRQFYGTTPEIQLSNGAGNTTIIYGNNGAGKTTLLNAFTWALYEEFTAAFAHAEQLVNKRAIQEAIPGKFIEYFVELNFEHEYKSYQLKRRCYATKKTHQEVVEESESQLFMLVAGDDGCWQPPLEQPEEIIGRILPASLHQYFFFDGERIDHIIRYQKKTGLTEATKELLGIKIFERSAEHLKNSRRSLEEELQKIGNIQTQTLLNKKQQLEQEIELIQARQNKIEQEIAEKQQIKQQLGAELLTLKGAENLQTLKNNLERDTKATREKLVHLHQDIKRIVSSQGYTVLMTSLAERCSDLFAALEKRQEIPSGIKKPFVQHLLNQQRCICGTSLIPGTLPHDQVKIWMDQAGGADVEESLIRLQMQTQQLEKQALQFWETIDDRQEQVTVLREKLANLEQDLETVKRELREYPDQKIKKLQVELDRTEKELENCLIEKGRNEIELRQKTEQLDTLNQKLNQEEAKEAKQKLVQRRREATEAAITCIKQLKANIEHRFQITLEQKVQEIFADISFTPYLPKLNANYELSLVERTTGEEQLVAASTGENQILSLSLLGGIIDRVRHWSANNTLIALDSSTFPMVMDSPFGSLDEVYRRQVAKALPKLANQLVVLVTKTQWRGEVAEEMNKFVGKQYVLVYCSPKADCTEDGLTINGNYYPLVQASSNEFEYTEIREIKN
ncbi:MAG: AAA family ATPase [Cyanobacteria bacterium]|jgi:DNA sulfur modification protein DndD|nr:AAA family ATPase [Cyanobacteria bacterium GSL.Bin21]